MWQSPWHIKHAARHYHSMHGPYHDISSMQPLPTIPCMFHIKHAARPCHSMHVPYHDISSMQPVPAIPCMFHIMTHQACNPSLPFHACSISWHIKHAARPCHSMHVPYHDISSVQPVPTIPCMTYQACNPSLSFHACSISWHIKRATRPYHSMHVPYHDIKHAARPCHSMHVSCKHGRSVLGCFPFKQHIYLSVPHYCSLNQEIHHRYYIWGQMFIHA